jgi:tetratricopeptide (TPR) repeat protein
MKTIFADFNAINAAGNFWLNCRGSERDLREAGVQVGDWIWLSDGELIVGAQLAFDDAEGPIGMPRWKTLVHLDDEETQKVSDVQAELFQILPRGAEEDPDVEARVFQLLTILEVIAPESVKDGLPPGYLAKRRAGALHFLGEWDLSLLVLEEALDAMPDDPNLGFLYMEALRRIDLDHADAEAGRRAEAEGTSARMLAACINVRSAVADQVSDEEFAAIGPQILNWAARFEQAPGRDQVRAALLAQVLFNQGLTLLRLGRFGEAREALGRARAVNPNESAIVEASRLESYDDRAREIASRIHGMPPLVAA